MVCPPILLSILQNAWPNWRRRTIFLDNELSYVLQQIQALLYLRKGWIVIVNIDLEGLALINFVVGFKGKTHFGVQGLSHGELAVKDVCL